MKRAVFSFYAGVALALVGCAGTQAASPVALTPAVSLTPAIPPRVNPEVQPRCMDFRPAVTVVCIVGNKPLLQGQTVRMCQLESPNRTWLTSESGVAATVMGAACVVAFEGHR